MLWFRPFAIFLVLAGFLAGPMSLSACPLCKEAISSGGTGEEEEINNAPAAYNQSILLMIGVPYFLLGGVGLLIYRGCSKNAEYLRELGKSQGDDPPPLA